MKNTISSSSSFILLKKDRIERALW